MDALILFSHGSVLCGAGEALDAHAERLRGTGDWPIVQVGYMNYSEPTFAEAVAACTAQGATRIVVLPFFLIPGYFVTKTLPEQLRGVQADYPDLEFVVADAIGYDVGFSRRAHCQRPRPRSAPTSGVTTCKPPPEAAAPAPTAPSTPRPTAPASPPRTPRPGLLWSNALWHCLLSAPTAGFRQVITRQPGRKSFFVLAGNRAAAAQMF